MRRRVARPYGGPVRPTRIVSLLFAVALLYVFYEKAKDPETWRRFTGEQVDAPAEGPTRLDWAKLDANVASGPNDRDSDEKERGEALLELVRDKRPLRPQEMSAYWTLMNWSMAEPFRDLEKRARPEVPFAQIWEQPDRYRGELMRLRLHVTRVLEFESPPKEGEAPRRVYEAWGWASKSSTFPYVVVFPELPEGLPVGDKVTGELVFVGYFLKVMSYTPADASQAAPLRGAPLLVGRARLAESPAVIRKRAPAVEFTPPVIIAIAAGVAAIIGLAVWSVFRDRRPRPAIDADGSSDQKIDLGSLAPGEEFRLFEASPPADRGILPSAPRRPDESS